MLVNESVHRYPRLLTWSVELLSAIAVGVAAFQVGSSVLRLTWQLRGVDQALFGQLYWLKRSVRWLRAGPEVDTLGLVLTLAGLAFALFVALMLRNMFPIVRSSARGLLVEFAGSWLAIPWEGLRALKVTEDLAGERFVLLALTDAKYLTPWHRVYSLIYGLDYRRGFLISSSIQQFDDLVRSMLGEMNRVARVHDLPPGRLEENSWSPLFRFLLSPASFFSRQARSERAATTAETTAITANTGATALRTETALEVVAARYPARISGLLAGVALLVLVLGVIRYVILGIQLIALLVPGVRSVQPFYALLPRAGINPLWMLLSMHLTLGVAILAFLALRSLLPALETRPEGLLVQDVGKGRLLPWNKIRTLKGTDILEESQIVLVETGVRTMPLSSRLAGLLYDGSWRGGILVTSAASNFEALLRTILHETRSARGIPEDDDETPLLQRDAQSWPLFLALKPSAAIDELVQQLRDDPTSTRFDRTLLGPGFAAMAWLALPTALLPALDLTLNQLFTPSPGLLVGILVLWLLGLLEWPIIATAAQLLDDNTGGGEEGLRGLYLYPIVQLPRMLALLPALLLVVLGVPALPIILWIAAIGWSFVLAMGLWAGLYDWRGSLLLAGGLGSVVWQLIVLALTLVIF